VSERESERESERASADYTVQPTFLVSAMERVLDKHINQPLPGPSAAARGPPLQAASPPSP
jgi:hypothetical protein